MAWGRVTKKFDSAHDLCTGYVEETRACEGLDPLLFWQHGGVVRRLLLSGILPAKEQRELTKEAEILDPIDLLHQLKQLQ